MIKLIKKLIANKKKRFERICDVNNLNLNYQNNKNGLDILSDIFEKREYANYFPFYQKVTIVDIGAHYGYFSLFAKNNIDEDSKIYSLEPNKCNFKNLEENFKDCNLTNINCFNYALGGKNEISKLYHGKSINNSIIDNYSMLDKNLSFEEVQIQTLEDFIIQNELVKIDFLKMDCEGAEYSILESTPKHIFDMITTISMEFHDLKNKNISPEDLIKKLTQNDFEIVKYKYEKTSMNLNYGKIIGTKILK
jgi:FkbM family methyltransferase